MHARHALLNGCRWTVGLLLCLPAAEYRTMIGSSIAPGGFVEKAGAQTFRPRFTPSQIAAFLPAGRFTFPAP